MFASQLIRILDTLPYRGNNATCAFDADELNGNMKENQNGVLFHINSPVRYGDPLVTEINDKDGYWNTPEFECAMVLDDFTDVNESEIQKSHPDLHSEFFEDTDMYTDKKVLECELPEMMVCYKESEAYHVVKDICVDEGIHSGEKILIENHNDNNEALTVSLSVNRDKCGDMVSSGKDCGLFATNECDTLGKLDSALLTQEVHKDTSSSLPINGKGDLGEKEDGADPLTHDGLESKYENKVSKGVNLLILDGQKDEHGDLGGRDTDTESLLQENSDEFGTKQVAHIDILAADLLKENSVDSDEKAFPESGPASNSDKCSADECAPGDLVGTVEDNAGTADNLIYDASGEESDSNSMLSVKVFRPQTSLKFLLNSLEFGDDDDTEQQPDQIPVAELSKSLSAESEIEEASSSGQASSIPFISDLEIGNITFNFNADKAAAIFKDESSKTDNDPRNGDRNLDDLTKASLGQLVAGGSSFSVAGPISGLITDSGPDHEDGTSDMASLARLVRRGDGESSFSVGGPVSGRIMYSGPIPYSGSISLRSESSTTSTRSFAFPVLQNEWNSSPVRMAKAERRRFRKHGGWRQGLLCCRF